MFNVSDYPQYSKFFYSASKKVLSKMKNKFGGGEGGIIREFAGLKSKMFCLVNVDEKRLKNKRS